MGDSMEVDEADFVDDVEVEQESEKSEKKRSVLWKYFVPINQSRAKCTLCNLVFSYKTSISNLKIHIQRKHHDIALPGNKLNRKKLKFRVPSKKKPIEAKPESPDKKWDFLTVKLPPDLDPLEVEEPKQSSVQSKPSIRNSEKIVKESVPKDAFIFGSSDFSSIADKSWYVDKTPFIKTVLKECDRLLITTPRRCGKSTNLDMLKKFVEIEVNNNGDPVKLQMGNETRFLCEQQMSKNFNLFTDKKIFNITRNGRSAFNKTFYTKHFGKYQVINISFKNIIGDTYQEILGSLRTLIHLTYRQHKYLTCSRIWDLGYSKDIFSKYIDFDQYDKIPEEKLRDSLRYLSELLCAHFDTENKVFVLIDELDTPLNKIVHNKDFSDDDFRKTVKFIQILLSCLLKDNPYVERALTTGKHHYAEILLLESNFVHKPYLQSENFVRYSGLTSEEVEGLLADLNLSDNFNEVKVWYNSYGMSLNDGTLVEIYNNWSIMQYLYERDLRSYLPYGNLQEMRTVLTRTILRDKIEVLMSRRVITVKYKEKLGFKDALALKNMINDADFPMEEDHIHLIFQYLYEEGYLNLLFRTEETLELGIPNIEIFSEFCKVFFSYDFFIQYYKVTDDSLESFVEAVLRLKTIKDQASFLFLAKSIKDLFQNSRVLPQNDFELQAPLYHYLKKHFPNIKGQALTMPKRYLKCDIGVPVDDKLGIAIELTTYDRGTSLDALNQIVSNKYNDILSFDGLDQEIYIGLHLAEDRKISLSYLVNSLDLAFSVTVISA